MWSYHLPEIVAVLGLGALALLLLASPRRTASNPAVNSVMVLFLLAIAIAIAAAVAVVYPLGNIRQNLYLGPVVFLAAGSAFHLDSQWIASYAAHRARFVRTATLVAIAGAIALAGVSAMRRDNPYRNRRQAANFKAVLAALEERAPGDVVWVSGQAVPAMTFYREHKPAVYAYARSCWSSRDECAQRIADSVLLYASAAKRIWVVAPHDLREELLKELDAYGWVEEVVVGGEFDTYLVNMTVHHSTVSGEPAIDSVYDVHVHERALIYIQDPCVPADTKARFFLHVVPAEGKRDLPDYRKQYGFDNLDFSFDRRGVRFESKCMAVVPLPQYAISSIRTGQFLVDRDGSYTNLWEGEIRFDE